MTRSKLTCKHSREKELFFSPEDIRWATPELVAEYRAKRLKCRVIADLGCGIGLQTFAFAKYCEKVYAVEIDGEKIARAEKNAAVLGLHNVEFICGDCLDKNIIKKIKDAEIIFCDPERLVREKSRNIETIKPDIKELLDTYSKITPKIAVEFPPQIREIPFDCEREFISVNGVLNRLTLYFNELKRSRKSAIILPQGAVLLENKYLENKNPKEIFSLSLREKNKNLKPKDLEDKDLEDKDLEDKGLEDKGLEDKDLEDKDLKNGGFEKGAGLKKYLYEADPAVVKADLLAELCAKTKTACYQSPFFTSDKKINTPFFKNSYLIIDSCEFEDNQIISMLQKQEAGKVVLRFRVDPENYWKQRRIYESKLNGTKTFSLFKFGNEAFIAQLV